jgi:hypothetical protein
MLPHEAANEPEVWTALAWGGRRHLTVVRNAGAGATLASMESAGAATTRQGIIRGDRKKLQTAILERRILCSPDFPPAALLRLRAADLPINKDATVHSRDSSDFSAFEPPQMIMKQTWVAASGRFRAVMVDAEPGERGVLCDRAYVSVHVAPKDKDILATACLCYNSAYATAYLLLTSGRFASYRPEVQVAELLSLPLPRSRGGVLDDITDSQDVDDRVGELFGFNRAEVALIEDLFAYTLRDFKGGLGSPGRQPTRGCLSKPDTHLERYCDFFRRVLQAGFGPDKGICTTIFQEAAEPLLPLRIVAVHLDWPDGKRMRYQRLQDEALRQKMLDLYRKALDPTAPQESASCYPRVLRLYDTVAAEGKRIPTVFLVKPDQVRYWTRTMAMRDADQVAADIGLWENGTGRAYHSPKERDLG